MKYIIRIFKRHTSTTLLMIMGFVVSFILLANDISLLDNMVNIKNETNKFRYDFETVYDIEILSNLESINIDELFKNVDGIIELISNEELLYVNGGSGYSILPKVILQYNEPFNIPTNRKKLKKNGVIISENIGRSNEENIVLGDKKYSIIDIIDSERYSSQLSSIYINYSDLPNEIIDKIKFDDFKVLISSNENTTHHYSKIIEENAKKTNILITYYELETEINLLSIITSLGVPLYFVIYLFSIINIITVTKYWTMDRRKEISIRKAFGIDNKHIIKILIKEMSSIIFIAIFICFIIQGIIALSFNKEFLISISFTWIISSIIMVLVMLIISLIAPLLFIFKIKPAEGVK